MSKQEKKKRGCLHNIVLAFAVLVVLSLFAGASNNTETDETTPQSSQTQSTQEIMQTPNVTAAPTTEPTPSTPEGWVKKAVVEEYGDDFISVSFDDTDSGEMITINCVFADNFTNGLRRDQFMFHARDILKELTQMREDKIIDFDLVFIHGKTTFIDKYGRESDGDAMQLCMAAEDLEQIVWDNMLIDMLPNIATTYAVHPLFRD